MRTTRTRVKAAIAGVLALPVLSLSACADDTAGPEVGTDVEDVQEEAEAIGYDGAYDDGFHDEVNTYDGKRVTLSADVNTKLSPTAFTIAGTDDTDVEPLLVLSADPATQITPGLTVKVTGTEHTDFELPTVEEELGVDLDDAVFEDWDGEPYVEAITIDTSVASNR